MNFLVLSFTTFIKYISEAVKKKWGCVQCNGSTDKESKYQVHVVTHSKVNQCDSLISGLHK